MRMPSHGKPCRRRVGAHIVEFAMVIPFFFLFVFGLIEIGRGMMVSSLVTNAARAGCRTGIVPGRSNTDVTNAVNGLLQAQGVSDYTTTITVNGSNSTNVNAAQSGDTIIVTVTVPIVKASWLPSLSFLSGNITGRFSMPHE
jgi:Flp pilus assembly protein TadG